MIFDFMCICIYNELTSPPTAQHVTKCMSELEPVAL